MQGEQLEQNESLEFYGKVRQEKNITIISMTREVVEGLVIYTAVGKMGDRQDSATGAVSIEGLTGLAKADAFKSAETQAKSRLTISLSGVRIEIAKAVQTAQPEPAVPEAPQVNQAKAEVVEDTRLAVEMNRATAKLQELSKAVTAAQESTSLGDLQSCATAVPAITETMISNLHEEAQSLDLPAPSQTDAEREAASLAQLNQFFPERPEAAKPPMPETDGFSFDDEPETLVAPTLAPVPVPEPVDAVLAAVQQPTATGVVMPVPVPKAADQPTRLQYQEFTKRCTVLCRDVLPKADKGAPALLLPYLRKKFGVKELAPETTSISGWEAALTQLEKAGSPAETLKILKGGN